MLRPVPALTSTLALTLLLASCSHLGERSHVVHGLSAHASAADIARAYPVLLEYDVRPCPQSSPLAPYYAFWEKALGKAPATLQDIKDARIALYACLCSTPLSDKAKREADDAAVQLEHSDRMMKAKLAFQKAQDSGKADDFSAFLAAASVLEAFRNDNPDAVLPELKAYEQNQPDTLGLEFASLFKDTRHFLALKAAWTCEESDNGTDFRPAEQPLRTAEGKTFRLHTTLVLPRFRHQTFLNLHALPADTEIILNGVPARRIPKSPAFASVRIPLPDFDSLRGSVEISIHLPAKIPPSIPKTWLSEQE